MIRRALVGHTGFVGGTLLRQTDFDDGYNSSNIEEIRGRRYDLLVCAGAPAEKWRANREPERDRENLHRLMGCLGDVEAGHVILISTVDVYATPVGVDEQSPVDDGHATAYGRHRRSLERFLSDRFESLVVRLPGLFGEGMKKNIIYDLLHDKLVDQISPESVYQFYDLRRLWTDLELARSHGLRLVNFVTAPVSVREVAREAFGQELATRADGPPVRYDVRSRHAELFGGGGGYLCSRAEVLAGMAGFVAAARAMRR